MERSEQELVRIEKLDKIRECCNPYPDKTHYSNMHNPEILPYLYRSNQHALFMPKVFFEVLL